MTKEHKSEGSETKESMHWADQAARDIIERVENNPLLKKNVKEHGYIVYDEKTPSGNIHIGSGRGWVIHDAIAKSLRDKGVKGRFILSSDDIDPFDRVTAGLPEDFNKYLGVPLRDIPSPVKGYESYAEYYFMQCVERFEEFGIEAEIEHTGELYDTGQFNPYIKIVLNSLDKIKAIYESLSSKAYDKFPFNPICGKCGKIGTTRVISWDAEKEMVKYRCEPAMVEWASGCGHEGETSPYDGNGKFPWKVEWAAKWPVKKAVYEVAGKDHFTKGGSRDTAIRICDQVFNYPIPLPSSVVEKEIVNKRTKNKEVLRIYEPGPGYEFFQIGGRKMSTSKGLGISFAEATEVLPAYMVRYLLIRSRPHTPVDFDPNKPNDIPLLYDRFDKTERIYFGAEAADEKEKMQNKRVYELSRVGKLPAKLPIQIPLTFASSVLQVGKDEAGALELLRKSGHISEEVSGQDLHHLSQRLIDAKQWLDNFASDDYKFIVNDKVSDEIKGKLSSGQRKALKQLGKELGGVEGRRWKEEELHNRFWDIAKENGIEAKEFFEAAYSVLISKQRGPKLANFVLAIGKGKSAELFSSL